MSSIDIMDAGNIIAKKGPGETFGDVALLFSCPRSATVKAATDLVCWALEGALVCMI